MQQEFWNLWQGKQTKEGSLQEFRVHNGVLIGSLCFITLSSKGFSLWVWFVLLLTCPKQTQKTREDCTGRNSDKPPLNLYNLYNFFVQFVLRFILEIHKMTQYPWHPPIAWFVIFYCSGIHICVPHALCCHYRQSFVPNAIHMFSHNARRLCYHVYSCGRAAGHPGQI